MFISKRLLALFCTMLAFFSELAGSNLTPRECIMINSTNQHQTIDSWGTSSAWWSQLMSDGETADTIADLLYGEDGLGLNTYRFNIGAGSKDNPAERIVFSDRKTESFYYYNEASGEFEYDFTRDASAVMMMDKALAAGADSVIMFCNSPHYSMTKNGESAATNGGGESNLAPENYHAFVDYVLTIADHFYSAGYPVTYISPINEPQWDWGGDWVGQEGCHFSPEETVNLLEAFAVEMQKRNTPYGLMGPESGAMGEDQHAYIELFAKSEILTEYCDSFCGHSYWLDGNIDQKTKASAKVHELMPDKKFDMSEWCELPCTLKANTVDSALYMARIITEDLNYLEASSWSSWTAAEVQNEINEDCISDRFFAVKSDMSELITFKRYYAYKHFSHFIPAGSVRIDSLKGKKLNDINTVTYERPDGSIVLVAVNTSDTAHTVKIPGYKIKEMYITNSEKNCEQVSVNRASSFKLAEKSMVTVILGSSTVC